MDKRKGKKQQNRIFQIEFQNVEIYKEMETEMTKKHNSQK